MAIKLIPALILTATGVLWAICADFIDFTNFAGVPGTGVGNGIAFGDYDNDGDLDLYVSSDPNDVLYRNNGDGSFEDVTIAAGIAVRGDGVGAVFGDYDNDGDLDIYVAVNDGRDVFFENDGNGAFLDVSRAVRIDNPNRARSATFVDYNNDGFLDIYVANEDAANILYRNNKGEMFEDVAQIMNVGHQGPGRCSVWGDYDNDGDLDLYVTNKGAANVLYRNDKEGFEEVTKHAGVEGLGNSTGVAFADYDNDSDLDIYVDGDEVFLYRNNGDGTFTNVAKAAGLIHSGAESTPAFGDCDNDGDLDLYLAVWKGKAVMYNNNGDGTFEDVTEAAGMGAVGNGWSAVFSDYDGDGDLDIYASYTTGSNILYQNTSTNNNWLHVKTIGSSSNRNGVGARIKLLAGGVWQMREVSGGSGYGSQGSFAVEFGLGKNVVADVLEVTWPSGAVTRLTNVSANRTVLVEESFWAVEELTPEMEVQSSQVQVPKVDHTKPNTSKFLPNYPNPFNPETWLPYQLAVQANVTIAIYNSSGRLVHTLRPGIKGPGFYVSKAEAAHWDGRGDDGELVAAGIYFCQLKAGEFLQIRKIVLEK